MNSNHRCLNLAITCSIFSAFIKNIKIILWYINMNNIENENLLNFISTFLFLINLIIFNLTYNTIKNLTMLL